MRKIVLLLLVVTIGTLSCKKDHPGTSTPVDTIFTPVTGKYLIREVDDVWSVASGGRTTKDTTYTITISKAGDSAIFFAGSTLYYYSDYSTSAYNLFEIKNATVHDDFYLEYFKANDSISSIESDGSLGGGVDYSYNGKKLK